MVNAILEHESFCLDSLQKQLFFWDDFEGDQLKDEWGNYYEAGGTTAIIDGVSGGIVRLTSHTDLNDQNLLYWTSIRTLILTKNCALEGKMALGATTNCNMKFGMYGATGWMNTIYASVSDTHWGWSADDAGTTTVYDAALLADTNYHIHRTQASTTGGNHIHFHVDNTELTSSPCVDATRIYLGYMQPYITIQTVTGAKTMDIDYVAVRQDR